MISALVCHPRFRGDDLTTDCFKNYRFFFLAVFLTVFFAAGRPTLLVVFLPDFFAAFLFTTIIFLPKWKNKNASRRWCFDKYNQYWYPTSTKNL